MVQTRSMTNAAAKKKMAKGSDKLEVAKKAATEAVRLRSTKKVAANTPAELSEFEKEATSTMRSLLAEQAAGINRDERISRTAHLMEYLMTAGGEYLITTNATFRITVDKKIQELLMDGVPVKLAILLCRVHQKYFP